MFKLFNSSKFVAVLYTVFALTGFIVELLLWYMDKPTSHGSAVTSTGLWLITQLLLNRYVFGKDALQAEYQRLSNSYTALNGHCTDLVRQRDYLQLIAHRLLEYCDESDEAKYGTLSTSLIRTMLNEHISVGKKGGPT